VGQVRDLKFLGRRGGVARLRAAALTFWLVLAGCAGPSGPAAVPAAPASQQLASSFALRLLGSATLAQQPEGMLRHWGGISGIDRDAATGVWYLLSDDRSARAPARFYTATIDLDASGIHSIRVTGVVPLKQADGSVFPGLQQGGEVPDPEALRIDPVGGDLVWSSEGDRKLGLSPFVRRAARDGRFMAALPLPDNLRSHPGTELGARDNLAIEGLAFTPDASSLWVAMEAPLYEDGPVPTQQQGGFARFTRLDRQGRVLGQYAYPLDAIPQPASGGRRRADNGVSEILSTDDGTLLVVERSGREVEEGVFQFAIRLYEASAAGATDVSRMASLQRAEFTAMRKRLVLDLSTAGLGDTDNIEAAAWGPRLPNGNATLLLVSDDNFHPRQASRFWAFEVERR
jgi:hypothetical protein